MLTFERYSALFRVPGLKATLRASAIGRLPIGIAGLAILLFVQGRSGSFALAGFASALYVLGLGLVAPFLGRFIDRLGPRPVLTACAFLYPAALIGLAALVLANAHAAWIGTAALLAGASLPPISACIRALYPRIVSDPSVLQTAYTVDSVLVEAIFILGPALVAACVGLGRPEAAVLLAAVSASAGSAVFMRAAPVRAWSPAASRVTRTWLGVLRYPQLLVVFGATLLYSIAFGLFEVAVTAHAARKGAPAVAGVALALASLGSGLGALVYGGRHWRAPLKHQFVLVLAFMACGMSLLVPIENLTLYAVANIAAGLPMATVIATQSLLISRLVPRERLAEGFTWGTTCLLGGISAGIAAGGVLAERLAPHWLLVAAVTATTAAMMIVGGGLRRDEP